MEYTLDKENSLLHVRPKGPLAKKHFDDLAEVVDPLIEQTGGLRGLILETAGFPGWENLGAAVRHFRFVRDHHRKIKRIAAVTDSPLGEAAEHITSHFVAAEIRHFPAGHVEEARTWITSR